MTAAPKITHRKAAELKPSPTNARVHGPEQVEQIAASLVQFGFTVPVLADGDGIVAGHGRVLGALKVYESGGTLRYPNGAPVPEGTVPVIDCTGWSPEQRRAYVIADNQIALQSGWDTELLQRELEALSGADFPLDTIGFDQAAIDALIEDESGGTGRERNGAGGSDADTNFHHVDQFAVIVRCASEAEQEARFNALRDLYGADDVKVVVV